LQRYHDCKTSPLSAEDYECLIEHEEEILGNSPDEQDCDSVPPLLAWESVMDNDSSTICSCWEEDDDSNSMPSLLAHKSDTDDDSTICSDCEDDIEGETSDYTSSICLL
jgi:hypothetical protein